MVCVGTAGWTVPAPYKTGSAASHLQQYAQHFSVVEVNSCFYKPHRQATWRRWAQAVPDNFRFSVKLSKTITHDALLQNCQAELQAFLDQVRTLEEKLAVILVQLPPSLPFDPTVAEDFFSGMREQYQGRLAIEPRHATWFGAQPEKLLQKYHIARVAADPPKGSALASQPGGSTDFRYYRLHGSPRTYYSSYDTSFLQNLATSLLPSHGWVIFDNTALGHAYGNALQLKEFLKREKTADTC